MCLDRLHAEPQSSGDFLVAIPGGNQSQDLCFPLTEGRNGLVLTRALSRKESGGDSRRESRIQVLSARSRSANRLQQLGWRALLQHVARHARSQQFLQVGIIAMP